MKVPRIPLKHLGIWNRGLYLNRIYGIGTGIGSFYSNSVAHGPKLFKSSQINIPITVGRAYSCEISNLKYLGIGNRSLTLYGIDGIGTGIRSFYSNSVTHGPTLFKSSQINIPINYSRKRLFLL